MKSSATLNDNNKTKRKVDNNSKSDRRTSKPWRFSRTTASPTAITKSLGLKKKRGERKYRNEEEYYGDLRYYSRVGKFLYRGIPRQICKRAEARHTKKNALRTTQLFSFYTATLRFRASSFTISRQIGNTLVSQSFTAREWSMINEFYLLFFLICEFMRLEKREVCHAGPFFVHL